HVMVRQPIAVIRAEVLEDLPQIEQSTQAALRFGSPDVDFDPSYGVRQLGDIGWTSVSSAKSNPYTGLVVIHGLADLLVDWSTTEPDEVRNGDDDSSVAYSDTVISQALSALESVVVSARE